VGTVGTSSRVTVSVLPHLLLAMYLRHHLHQMLPRLLRKTVPLLRYRKVLVAPLLKLAMTLLRSTGLRTATTSSQTNSKSGWQHNSNSTPSITLHREQQSRMTHRHRPRLRLRHLPHDSTYDVHSLIEPLGGGNIENDVP